MRIVDKILRFLRRYIGIMFILGSVTFAGVAVWMLVDKTMSVTTGERAGSAAATFLFALLAFWIGKKILGSKRESEGAAYRRRQQMLGDAGWTDWKKYARRYAESDRKTLEEALLVVWNTSDIGEFRVSYQTARECLQILEKARQAGMQVELNYDLRRLESDKPKAVETLIFRAVTRALREKEGAGTREEKQKWIDWIRQGMEELYREEAASIDPAIYNRAMGVIDSAERSV